MSDERATALMTSPAFARMGEDDLHKFASIAELVDFQPGETIIRKGDPGDALYVIVSGEAEVTVDDPGGPEEETTSLREGDFFGEMAIIWNQPRTASIKAAEALTLVRFPREPLVRLLKENRELVDVLAQVGLLRAEENIERFLIEEL